jgi:hypothetical protein
MKQYADKIFVTLSFLLLGIIAALRSNTVGSDTALYEQIYSSDRYTVINLENFDLYTLYSRIVSNIFGENPHVITSVNSILIAILFGVAVYRLSKAPLLTTLLFHSLYFYLTSLNVARQFIAVGLVLNAFYFLSKNKKVMYFIFTAMAISVHASAIISLLYFVLSKIKWTWIKLTIIPIVLTIFSIFFGILLTKFILFFPHYQMYVQGNSGFQVSTASNGSKVLINIFYLSLLVFYFIWSYRWKIKIDKSEWLIASSLLFGSLIGFAFLNNLLMSRVEMYFTILIIFFVPILVLKFCVIVTEKKAGYILFSGAIFLISLVPFAYQLLGNFQGILPYVTY